MTMLSGKTAKTGLYFLVGLLFFATALNYLDQIGRAHV